MRISDWSSDVCSSDLLRIAPYYTRVHDYIDVVKLADFTNMMGTPTGFVQLRFANREAELYGVDVSGSLALWQSSSAGTAKLTATASRSEEHTSELQSLMRISYAVFCLKKKKIDAAENTTNLTK